MASILIVEDNQSCAECLTDLMKENEWSVEVASSLERADKLVTSRKFDVILLDLNVEGQDGFTLLEKIDRMRLDTKTIMISGSMGVRETVRAMKLGAWHCFPKPINSQELVKFLNCINSGILPHNEPLELDGKVDLIGVSEPMMNVKKKLRQIGKAKKATVIITGETGTGKEVVARWLHENARSGKPMVAVNCSAIPASLIESELFGHEKGAFTDARNTRRGVFEMAVDGTLFLDEIGDLPLEYQAKLLRALQERCFRRVGGTQEIPLQATIIAATNVDLADAVKKGKFREDLYYRLSVIPVHLPPLRMRGSDIVLIADYFLKHFASENDADVLRLSESDKQQLMGHKWPGNIRELRNVMERFVLFGRIDLSTGQRTSVSEPRMNAVTLADAPVNKTPHIDSDEERRVLYSILKNLMAEDANRLVESGRRAG
ncbi:MAG: sigma-54 dependent transcriptional regulator [Planctomycetota bacterium]